MSVKNIMVCLDDNGNYTVDLQCGEEHLGQECDCRSIATTKCINDGIILGKIRARQLGIDLIIENKALRV